MSTLYISEYNNLGQVNNGLAQVAIEPALVDQTVAISGMSTQSNAFSTSTRYIRVHTDSICSILVGSNPTALTTSKRLQAGQTEYFGVAQGAKIAVITNT